jgi:hypothetical protein
MMKKIAGIVLSAFIFFSSYAQDNPSEPADPMKGKFRRDNIFIGGSLGAGFTSGSFSVGANPEIGYTIAEWLDAGLVFNINYNSIKADFNNGIRQRAINYGGGTFFRLYPLRFLFLQGQLEQNWIRYNLRDQYSGQTGSITTNATSFLAGVGYTQRMVGASSYYIVIMADFMRDPYSPYLDNTYGNKRMIPIVRAGYNFYLKPSRR